MATIQLIEDLVRDDAMACLCCGARAKCQCELVPLIGEDSESGVWAALYCTHHRIRAERFAERGER